MDSKRESWVDYIKVLACILVILGHFFQSMVKSNILPDNTLFQWTNKTIYYFHVQLFFICSGYLYQKYSIVDSWKTWGYNVIKKFVNLGIPFFAFSSITWVIKTVFADSTSNAIGKLGEILFINPYPPYWYLYVLFFAFLLTPTLKSIKGTIVVLSISVLMKMVLCSLPELPIWKIYVVHSVFSYTIWFVLGMSLSVIGAEKIKKRSAGVILFSIFLIISIFTFDISSTFLDFGMTTLSCTAVFMLMALKRENKVLNWFAKYTMPIFLMHTLIAAPVRIMLVKIGIVSAFIHVPIGLIASVIGPIITINIMEKIRLDVFVYPGKYIRIKSR